MKKSIRHSGVLMMLGVFAIALMGSAYTLWYEDLSQTTMRDRGPSTSTGPFTTGTAVVASEGTFDATGTSSGTDGRLVAGRSDRDRAGNLEGGVADLLGLDGNGTGAGAFQYSNFPEGKPQPTCEGVIETSDSGDANDDASNNVLNLYAGGLYPYAGCE
ncbi:MAG: hypothetical protein U5Q44_10915 [Dehalococcoidia bacterium]|nr:hypothetical protein [Dehalococcoidia bacterium]